MATRNPSTGRFVKVPTPASVRAVQAARAQAEATAARERYEAARRNAARRAGYRGPLTRAELAAHGYVPTVR